MKRIISIVLAIVMLLSMNVFAFAIKAQDNVVLEYDEETQTLTVSCLESPPYGGNIGSILFSLVPIPENDNIKHIIVEEGVTDIAGSFCSLRELVSVSLPSTILGLTRCFNSCPKLEKVEIKSKRIDMDDSFYDCESLREISLGGGIYSGSFYYSGLEFASIGDRSSIFYGCFAACPSLKTVILGKKNHATFDPYPHYDASEYDLPIPFAEAEEKITFIGYGEEKEQFLQNHNCEYYVIPELPKTMTTKAIDDGIVLEWTKKEGVTKNLICRREKDDDQWILIGKSEGTTFCDTTAKRGDVYQYMNCSTFELSDEISYTDLKFEDVANGSWYERYTHYAAENKIMTGVSDTEFAPNMTVDRATFVTALAKLSGEYDNLDNNTQTVFEDVPAGKWYTGAVAWAYENKIINGIDETTFAPTDKITREQLCTMLFRYSEKFVLHLKIKKIIRSLKVDGRKREYVYQDYLNNTIRFSLEEFSDGRQVSYYAKEAVATCIVSGIVNGMGDGTFAPKETATRAQMAKILTLFHKNYMA